MVAPPRADTPPLPPGTPPPIPQDLSILEPFKTSTFTGIPGLDATSPPRTDNDSPIQSLTGSLGGPSKVSATTPTKQTIINLDDSPHSSPGGVEVIESNPSDLDVLQKNIDDLNKRIEREQQAINSISMGIVQKEDLGSECLANIALPSNLQQILDSLKSKKPEDLSPEPSKAPSPVDEEYEPTQVSYKRKTEESEDSLTIPLMLPKKPRQFDLNIPLNLPNRNFKRRYDSSRYDAELDQIPLNIPMKKLSRKVEVKEIEHDDITSEEEEMEDEPYEPQQVDKGVDLPAVPGMEDYDD